MKAIEVQNSIRPHWLSFYKQIVFLCVPQKKKDINVLYKQIFAI